MSSWHEVNYWNTEYVSWSLSGKFQSVISVEYTEERIFVIFFREWRREHEPLSPSVEPDGWVNLLPQVSLKSNRLEVAKTIASSLMASVEAKTGEVTFVERPYSLPPKPDVIEHIEHEQVRIRATIIRHAAQRFEVRYFVAFDESLDDMVRAFPPLILEALPLGAYYATMADSIEEARRVARIEMALFVADQPNSLLRR